MVARGNARLLKQHKVAHKGVEWVLECGGPISFTARPRHTISQVKVRHEVVYVLEKVPDPSKRVSLKDREERQFLARISAFGHPQEV